MKRFTKKRIVAGIERSYVNDDDCCDTWSVPRKFEGPAIERLADYEDAMPVERAQELSKAEKDGRLVVLPPNGPLTPEELRQMDGEPVWITPGGFWALVIARPGERVKLISNDGEVVFADKEIELVGPVYRRKPEKGGEHGAAQV